MLLQQVTNRKLANEKVNDLSNAKSSYVFEKPWEAFIRGKPFSNRIISYACFCVEVDKISTDMTLCAVPLRIKSFL